MPNAASCAEVVSSAEVLRFVPALAVTVGVFVIAALTDPSVCNDNADWLPFVQVGADVLTVPAMTGTFAVLSVELSAARFGLIGRTTNPASPDEGVEVTTRPATMLVPSVKPAAVPAEGKAEP